MNDAISVEIQWRDDGARCKALMASLVGAHFQAMRERVEGEEPLLLLGKMTR